MYPDELPDDLAKLTKEQEEIMNKLKEGGAAHRRAIVDQELYEYFSRLPSAKSSDGHGHFALDGASLVLKHMGNDSLSQATTLHHVMSTMLNSVDRPMPLLKRFVAPKSVSADFVMRSMLEAVIASADESEKKRIETLGVGAIVKSVRERLEAGKAGKEDALVINNVFARIFG